MYAASERPPSVFKSVLRWLGEFDRLMETRPVDVLETRVADMERRLAALDRGGSDQPRTAVVETADAP